MNLMFNLEETVGLRLKPSAFNKEEFMKLFDVYPLLT